MLFFLWSKWTFGRTSIWTLLSHIPPSPNPARFQLHSPFVCSYFSKLKEVAIHRIKCLLNLVQYLVRKDQECYEIYPLFQRDTRIVPWNIHCSSLSNEHSPRLYTTGVSNPRTTTERQQARLFSLSQRASSLPR